MAELPPPSSALEACVVVPARDEEERIAACIHALARQASVGLRCYEVILVLDRTSDSTRARASRAALAAGLSLHVLEAARPGAGGARRTGMDAAFARLCAVGRRASGLIACTDADTRVDGRWLRTQLEAVAEGARAIGGRLELDEAESRELAPGVLAQRRRACEERLDAVIASTERGRCEHWNFSGASMAVTADTYAAVGRIEPLPALEDATFERALVDRGVPIDRLSAVSVTTSARRRGRASHGLARDLAAADRRHRGAGGATSRLSS